MLPHAHISRACTGVGGRDVDVGFSSPYRALRPPAFRIASTFFPAQDGFQRRRGGASKRAWAPGVPPDSGTMGCAGREPRLPPTPRVAPWRIGVTCLPGVEANSTQ